MFQPHFQGPGGGPRRGRPRPPSGSDSDESQFGALRASLLYCPNCKTATPARERLLLVLPSGNKYEYLCANCGTSTGEKVDQEQQEVQIFLP